jgi:uncharacterized peroxidase-related enzyme
MPAYPEYEKLSASLTHSVSTGATNLPVIEEDQASGEIASLYQRFRSEFGRPQVPGILKCFATHPPLLRSMIDLAQSLLFTDGQLTRRHKEMIAVFISARNSCPYCADSHGYFFRMHGGSAEALCALQDDKLETPALSGEERVLLRFVEQVTSESHSVTPEDIARLVQVGWTTEQISEAVHITALFASFNRVANAFGLQSQELLSLFHDKS